MFNLNTGMPGKRSIRSMKSMDRGAAGVAALPGPLDAWLELHLQSTYHTRSLRKNRGQFSSGDGLLLEAELKGQAGGHASEPRQRGGMSCAEDVTNNSRCFNRKSPSLGRAASRALPAQISPNLCCRLHARVILPKPAPVANLAARQLLPGSYCP